MRWMALAAMLSVMGCASMERSAAKDPMKCERDPKCIEKSRAADCSRQCSDDPACVDRCREMNLSSGAAQR